GLAVWRRRDPRAARLRDRGRRGSEALRAAFLAVTLIAAGAARAQPAADLERIQAAIAASREREATRARTAAEQARVELAETERTMHDAAERLVELERAMAQRAVALYRAGEL